MSASKKKGTRFETAVVRWLKNVLGEGIERRALGGVADRGDVAGVFAHGRPVVIECKSTRSLEVSRFLREAEVERGNDDALAGVVVWKRPGISDRDTTLAGSMAEQLVCMTLKDFTALITGKRTEEASE